MIISQTPYRVSFAGGGTDLPAFYRHEVGAVVSGAITKHMYVTVSPRFDPTTRVAYTRVEIVDEVESLEHEIVREALKLANLGKHLEITTVGDVPAGTGMGSSSSLTVGLIKALQAYKGEIIGNRELAEKACQIEIELLGKPIGKQDQYAAAYGGLNLIRFHPTGDVEIEPLPCNRNMLEELERHALLLYTHTTRSADAILEKQARISHSRLDTLRSMRDLAEELPKSLTSGGSIDEFARILNEGWSLKRSLGCGISTTEIDERYQAAKRSRAMAGKLLGAGGGGFLFLLVPPERREGVRDALARPRELPFSIDRRGSKIIFVGDRHTF